jgi:histidine triad (HIT) family protein
MAKDCVFCKIAQGKIPAHIIWEDKKHIAFLTIFPNTSGFTVVATKNHKPSYAFENDDQTLKDLTLATKKVALLLDAAFDDVGRCGMFFEGFGVDHLHSKLFPMHGTANMAKWKPILSKTKEFYPQYPGHLSSHDGPRASDEELKKIASKIRQAAKKINL